MSIKSRLYDQAINALALAEGGADELSFGLVDKYVPGAKKLGEENPWASNIGRVGSYAIPLPLPNKLKALARAPEGIASLVKLLSHIPGGGSAIGKALIKGGEIATKGAARGLVEGEAQHAVRKALGTAQDTGNPSETGDRLALESTFGAGGSLLGKLMGKAAPAVYNHPALMNKFKSEDSEKLARELLDEGTMGTLKGAFKDRAQKFKDTAKVTFDELHNKIVPREQDEAKKAAAFVNQTFKTGPKVPAPKGVTNPRDIFDRYHRDLNEWKGTGVSRGEQKALGNAYVDAVDSLNPDQFGATNLEEVQKKLKDSNTRLSKLNARDRARMQGAQGLGESSAEIDRLKSVKDSYEEMYKRGIDDFGDGDLDTLAYNNAKRTHRKGADLAENMRTDEIYNAHSRPGFLHPDWFRNLARFTVASAPLRSAGGVALDRLAPKVGAAGGRAAELKSRNNGQPPEVQDYSVKEVAPKANSQPDQNDFEQFVPKANATKEQAKADEMNGVDAPEASRRFLQVSKKNFDAIHKYPTKGSPKTAEWQVGGKADSGEENPFLQFVPTR